MSALTKIGVVLLVITSLLLSAGIVVFVNKIEDFKKDRDALKARFEDAQSEVQGVKALLDAEVQNRIQASLVHLERISALKQTIADKEGLILQANAAKDTADKEKSRLATDLAAALQTQKGLQDSLAAAQGHVAELRKIRDDLVNKNNDLNVSLTDERARSASLERAKRQAEEAAEKLRADLNSLQTRVAQAMPAGLPAAGRVPASTAGAPSLEGVVSTVFNAGGKPWASISIGAKDNVSKDMKFAVINNQEFLGYLTIQQAEPTEAVGVLEGPKVDKVKAGDLVKTQLQ